MERLCERGTGGWVRTGDGYWGWGWGVVAGGGAVVDEVGQV